jgi:O-antigen/teichoic acid export membrane protein
MTPISPIATPAEAAGGPKDHFATGHLLSDLKSRSARGGAITIATQGVKFVLQVGSTMVLARLLTPEDFGLIAMVTSVAGFVAMFKDAGLSMATVQQENVSHEQVTALFWLNVIISIGLMLILAALSPAIALMYGEPRTLPVTLVIAATFIFSGLAVQHQALLRRQMRFHVIAVIDVVAMASGILAALAIALVVQTYWALVAIPVVTAIATAVATLMASSWRPGPPRGLRGVGHMVRFGGNLTLASFFTYAAQNIDKLFIGVAIGASPLGLYRKAFDLVMLPVRLQQGPVASVMLPALSRLQNDHERYRRAYLRVIAFLALIGGPVVAFVFAEAGLIVQIVLGSQWTDAAIVVQCFIPAAFISTLCSAPRYLFITTGHTALHARISAFEFVLVVFAVLAVIRGGLVHVAIAYSIATAIGFLVSTYYATRCSRISLREVASHLAPHGAAVLGGIVAVQSLDRFQPAHAIPRLLISLAVVCVAYIGVLAAFRTGRRAIRETTQDIRTVRWTREVKRAC